MPAFNHRLLAFFRRLRADRGGNILMLTAGSIMILALAIGFGIDYSRAQRLQTKLNAAADAAVLAAVDPSMLNQTTDAAKAAATAMFNYQIAGLPGLTILSVTITIPPDASGGSLGTLRTATLTYTATSTNSFAGILKMPSLPISGTATASASQPPSMNFYVAMDTSPSMLLPTTSTGITNLTAGAIWSGELPLYGQTNGCDFACHATNMQLWNKGTFVLDSNKNAIYLNSAGTDFYRVTCTATTSGSTTIPAGSVYNSSGTLLGGSAQIRTQSDNSGQAAGSASNNGCTTYTSSSAAPASNPVYIYYLPVGKTATTTTGSGKSATTTYNSTSIQVSFPDTYWLAQNYTTVNPGASDIMLRTDAEQQAAGGVVSYAYNVEKTYSTTSNPPIYKMQFYTFNQSGSTAPITTTSGGSSAFGTMTDVASLQSQTFPDMSAMVPNIADPTVSNPYTSFTSMLTTMAGKMPAANGSGTSASPQSVLIIITDGMMDDGTGISQFSAANVAQCTKIKTNNGSTTTTGPRIAILYTQYIPETVNYTKHPTFNTVASSYIPNVQSALQSCATQNADGTYLMQTVSTDGSVTTALNTLFAMVVQSARLTQ